MNCANGEPCTFYEGQTLEEYLTPMDVQQIDVSNFFF